MLVLLLPAATRLLLLPPPPPPPPLPPPLPPPPTLLASTFAKAAGSYSSSLGTSRSTSSGSRLSSVAPSRFACSARCSRWRLLCDWPRLPLELSSLSWLLLSWLAASDAITDSRSAALRFRSAICASFLACALDCTVAGFGASASALALAFLEASRRSAMSAAVRSVWLASAGSVGAGSGPSPI